jgi:protein-S-isoprenylcysteine O-methyltransferase Ste14
MTSSGAWALEVQIRSDEAFLNARGQAHCDYRNRVRRWI